ncbi:MAG: leucine-rich repeat domain-containing protein [Promethearchaeota archaeon]
MVDYVNYKGKKIRLPAKNDFKLLQSDLKDILELKDLFNYKKLGYLEIGESEISEIKGLDHFPRLKFLKLTENKISKISNLETLNKLETLILTSNQIRKIEGLDSLNNLIYLDLSHNQIKKIENLESLKNLKKLRLSFNKISKIENLDMLENLETLALSGNENITTIENLQNLVKLKTLSLQMCNIKRICGISELKNLEELRIGLVDPDNIITEIEGLENLVNLKYISIKSFNIDIEDMNNLDMVILLRFPCMIKTNSYQSIEDWQEIFKLFPSSFYVFQGMNPEKVEWYVHQCSENLMIVIQKILNDPEYDIIKRDQVKEWSEIYEIAKDIFSRKGPRKSLKEIVRKEWEEEEAKYMQGMGRRRFN